MKRSAKTAIETSNENEFDDSRFIEIPDSALASKAIYATKPSQRIVREIKEFLKKGGLPFLWHGHTHTKPLKGALVVYCGEFDLATEQPCPCCCPNHPKYKKKGKIAWFPEELVIRLLGPDCFKSLNPEGHQTALDDLRREERTEREINYLKKANRILEKMIVAANLNVHSARAFDEASIAITDRCDKIGINLRGAIRTGSLMSSRSERRVMVRKDGTSIDKDVNVPFRFASIRGAELISAARKPMLSRSLNTQEKLTEAYEILKCEKFEDMPHEERSYVYRLISSSFKSVVETREQIEKESRFLSTLTVNTLRTWGASEGADLRFYFAVEGALLYIGGTELQKTRIELNEAVFAELPKLPRVNLS
jgi:hypothetical protein